MVYKNLIQSRNQLGQFIKFYHITIKCVLMRPPLTLISVAQLAKRLQPDNPINKDNHTSQSSYLCKNIILEIQLEVIVSQPLSNFGQ